MRELIIQISHSILARTRKISMIKKAEIMSKYFSLHKGKCTSSMCLNILAKFTDVLKTMWGVGFFLHTGKCISTICLKHLCKVLDWYLKTVWGVDYTNLPFFISRICIISKFKNTIILSEMFFSLQKERCTPSKFLKHLLHTLKAVQGVHDTVIQICHIAFKILP